MPRAGPRSSRRQRPHLHRQHRPQRLHPFRHVLDGRLSHRRARLKHPTLSALLNEHGDSREEAKLPVGGLRSAISLSAVAGLLCVLAGGTVLAAEVDVSKLPPPAAGMIYFERDIKPILEKSCLRCHGPEKPKSRFRLDNRADALKGAEKGVD